MPAPELFKTEQDGNTLLVTFCEQAGTCSEADFLKGTGPLAELVRLPAVTAVVFDLGDMPYFTSILLNTLVSLWKQIRHEGCQMVLCNPSQLGREILELAKFDELWQIFDSRDEALAAVKS